MGKLLHQKENYQSFNSYAALVSLGANRTENASVNDYNAVYYKENNLINQIQNNPNLHLDITHDSNGNPTFYHVSKNKNSEVNYRLYLNCDNLIVPDLVNNLVAQLSRLDSYYFKFNPQNQSQKNPRSEQIVFYSPNELNLNQLVSTIRNLKATKPELFKGSENVNPFLKNIDGYICYAPQIKNSVYTDLIGNSKEIANSYNSLLSATLEDCFLHSIQDIVSRNVYLSKQMDFKYFSSAAPYVNVLDNVLDNDELKNKLIGNMKENLKIASRNNGELDIKGIDKYNSYERN